MPCRCSDPITSTYSGSPRLVCSLVRSSTPRRLQVAGICAVNALESQGRKRCTLMSPTFLSLYRSLWSSSSTTRARAHAHHHVLRLRMPDVVEDLVLAPGDRV